MAAVFACMLLGCSAGTSDDGGAFALTAGGGNGTDGDTEGDTEATETGAASQAGGNSGQGSGDGGGAANQDCCAPGDAAGCAELSVTSCVCEQMSTCCEDGWTIQCVGVAITDCGATCTSSGDDSGGDTTGAASGDDPPGTTSGTTNGDGMGDEAPMGPSCGELAGMNGWRLANCEANGNGACNGTGTPTWDCDFCCEVVL